MGAKTLDSGQFSTSASSETVWNYPTGFSLRTGLGAKGLVYIIISEETQVGWTCRVAMYLSH